MCKFLLFVVSLWFHGHTVYGGKSIEGKINIINSRDNSWIKHVELRAYADDDMFSGQLRDDGSFTIHDLPNKVFFVEVRHVYEEYVFTPVRVDLTGEEIIVSELNDYETHSPLLYPLVITGQPDSTKTEYSTWTYLRDLLVVSAMISLFFLALDLLRSPVEHQEVKRRNVLGVIIIVLLLCLMSKILPE